MIIGGKKRDQTKNQIVNVNEMSIFEQAFK
jgi:hypothetical protein